MDARPAVPLSASSDNHALARDEAHRPDRHRERDRDETNRRERRADLRALFAGWLTGILVLGGVMALKRIAGWGLAFLGR